MRNLIICFPGGAGGHFIAAVCTSLLYGKNITVDDNGSCHGLDYSRIENALDGRILDRSEISRVQELNVIQSMHDFDISLGHFRYLDLLTEHHKKCIYITFSENDKELIYKKLHDKTNPMSISKKHYETIMGVDWPSYDEFLQGNIHKEFLHDRYKKDWLADWFYVLPKDLRNVCEITFKEIYYGENLISKLCAFLSCNNHLDTTTKLIKEYRSKQ